jgi:hypothetical protein
MFDLSFVIEFQIKILAVLSVDLLDDVPIMYALLGFLPLVPLKAG